MNPEDDHFEQISKYFWYNGEECPVCKAIAEERKKWEEKVHDEVLQKMSFDYLRECEQRAVVNRNAEIYNELRDILDNYNEAGECFLQIEGFLERLK